MSSTYSNEPLHDRTLDSSDRPSRRNDPLGIRRYVADLLGQVEQILAELERRVDQDRATRD